MTRCGPRIRCISRPCGAQQIFGSLLADAELGFPVPCYPHCLQEADRYAQVVDLDLATLQNALDEAAAVSGGQPVTVNQAVDATETFKAAAIRQLARDEQFRAGVRTDRGIRWGFLQHKLAGFLPGTFGQDEQERSDWVYKHGLVKRALNEILGEDGWRLATPDGSQWVTATAQARSPDP